MLSAQLNLNFQFSSRFQRNHYLFLPWLILGFMLCIGLLVDVIYTAVVNFLDDQVTAGVLWLVIGFITVSKCRSRAKCCHHQHDLFDGIKRVNCFSFSLFAFFLHSSLFLLVGRRAIALFPIKRAKWQGQIPTNALPTIDRVRPQL